MKTKDRILEQARHLFNTQGVAAVSTADIAQALNISPGNLYYHFKNKQDLLVQLGEQCHQQLRPILEMLAIGQASWQELELQVLHLFEILANYIFITQDSFQLCHLSSKLRHRLQWIRQQLANALQHLLTGHIGQSILSQNLPVAVVAEQLALHCWYNLADQHLRYSSFNIALACEQLMAQLNVLIVHD